MTAREAVLDLYAVSPPLPATVILERSGATKDMAFMFLRSARMHYSDERVFIGDKLRRKRLPPSRLTRKRKAYVPVARPLWEACKDCGVRPISKLVPNFVTCGSTNRSHVAVSLPRLKCLESHR
jgi:hypothetical protein